MSAMNQICESDNPEVPYREIYNDTRSMILALSGLPGVRLVIVLWQSRGLLICEPLKAAGTGRCRGPKIVSLRSPAALIEILIHSRSRLRSFPTHTARYGHSGITPPFASIAELPLVCLAAHDWKFR